jgi:hypothetical protein
MVAKRLFIKFSNPEVAILMIVAVFILPGSILVLSWSFYLGISAINKKLDRQTDGNIE